MPFDPLASVTRVPRGTDPERRPTAPPPAKARRSSDDTPAPAAPTKRGPYRITEAGHAAMAANAARARAVRAEKVAAARTERDERIDQIRRERAAAQLRAESSDTPSAPEKSPERQQDSGAPPALLRDEEQTPVGGLTVPKGALPPPIVSAAPDAGTRRVVLSCAADSPFAAMRDAAAALGFDVAVRGEEADEAAAAWHTSLPSLAKVWDNPADAAYDELAPRPLGPAELAVELVAANKRIAELEEAAAERHRRADAASQRPDVAQRQASVLAAARAVIAEGLDLTPAPGLSFPAGADVVIEKLNPREAEVAIDIEIEADRPHHGRFRVCRARSGGEAVAAVVPGEVMPSSLTVPEARRWSAMLAYAAGMAEKLRACPDDDLPGMVLRALEDCR